MQERSQPLIIRRLAPQIVEIELDRHVGSDRRKGFALQGDVAPVFQIRPLLLVFHRVGMIQDLFQRAKLLQQLAGGFRADALDAGNVVARVAHQSEEVAHLLRPDAVFFYDLFRRVNRLMPHALAQRDDLLRHELQQVFVRTDDDRVDALRFGFFR